MKKRFVLLLALVLALAMVFALTACGSSNTPVPTVEEPVGEVAEEPAEEAAEEPVEEAPEESAEEAAEDSQVIKIGSLVGLTGYFSVWDTNNDNELRTMVDMVNEQGGITVGGQNYTFEVVTRDHQSDLSGVATAAELLAYEDEVDYVVETIGFFSVAAIDTFESNGILHINNWNTCSPDEINANTPYKFIGQNSTGGSVMALAQTLKNEYPDAESVVFCLAEDGTEDYQIAMTEAACKAAGLTLVDSIVYSGDIVDMSPVATQIKEISPDALIFSHLVSDAAGVAKILRANDDMTPIAYIGSTTAPEILSSFGDAATNIITVGVDKDNAENPETLKAFCEKHLATYGEDTVITACFPNCFYELVDAMIYADSVEVEDVKEALETMDTIESIYGTATFGGDETFGIAHHAIMHPSPITIVDAESGVKSYILYDYAVLP